MDDTKNLENLENSVLYNKRDNIDAPPRTVQSFMREIFEKNDGESDKSEEEDEDMGFGSGSGSGGGSGSTVAAGPNCADDGSGSRCCFKEHGN